MDSTSRPVSTSDRGFGFPENQFSQYLDPRLYSLGLDRGETQTEKVSRWVAGHKMHGAGFYDDAVFQGLAGQGLRVKPVGSLQPVTGSTEGGGSANNPEGRLRGRGPLPPTAPGIRRADGG